MLTVLQLRVKKVVLAFLGLRCPHPQSRSSGTRAVVLAQQLRRTMALGKLSHAPGIQNLPLQRVLG
jgi:hypothetical protein